MDPVDRDIGADEHDSVHLDSTALPKPDHSQPPAIDVVHVMGIDIELERLPLSQIISTDAISLAKELVFNIETPFLADDVVLTLELVEGEARRLLARLKDFRYSRSHDSAIVFVAYELGALVVKKAICLAENESVDPSWKDVFARSVRFIFHGCFQRRLGDQDTVLKMLTFLQGCGNNLWAQSLTARATEQLVKAVIQLNEVFLASDVIHRSRIFSLYTAESGTQRIPMVFDWYTATLGLPTELAVRNDSKDGEIPFPSLADKICCGLGGWIPESSLAAIRCTLTSVVPRQYQMQSTSESPSHPVLSSVSHRSWLRRSGVRVLYIHGPEHAANIEAAEQVALAWTTRNQSRKQYECRPFIFMFSPAHKEIRHMFAASMLHFMAEPYTSDLQDCMEAQVLEHMLQLQYAWTDEALCKAVQWARTWLDFYGYAYLLLDIDECAPDSRMTFWSFLAGIAGKTETTLKVVMTSKRPDSLLQELREFPEIQFDEYRTSNSPDECEALTDPDYQDTMIRRFCPGNLGETRIRTSFERLTNMSRPALESIVNLLSSTTRWPEAVTSSNLARFCNLFDSVTYESTSTTVLSRVLESVYDQSGLQWILGWLLCPYPPFDRGDLATILCYIPARLERKSPPSNCEVQKARMVLEDMLVGIVSWRNNRVEILPDILCLMDQDDENIWSRLRRSAPETTLTFLLEYLSRPTTQHRLDELFLQYQSRIGLGGQFGTPALVPKEPGDLIFYAVQALPHHLHATLGTPIHLDTTMKLKDPNGPFSAWSRVYWAMSNPFSRPSNLTKNDAVLSGMDQLLEAVRANNEDSALHLAQQLVDHEKVKSKAAGSSQGPTISWPSALLWGATWLNMHRLMNVFLRHGANVNDKNSKHSPSLIYTASRLGYSHMVELFLSYNADMTPKRRGVYTTLHAAVCHGHVGVIKAILAHRSDLINVEQPLKPLYAASIWGCWEAVECLIEFPGADINEKHIRGWTPLTAACDNGFSKTVRVLLDCDADPNIPGPGDKWTALYYAAAIRGDMDIVRMLLAQGAAIDHDGQDEPLLCGIVNSSILSVEDRISLFDILIQHDPSINIDNGTSDGLTPLMIAAMDGNATLITWLLRHGADINLTTPTGGQALFFALANRQIEATKELLKHDTSPILDVEDENSTFPLEIAVANQNMQDNGELVELLLDAGANLEFENKHKVTVLSVAVRRGQQEVVKLLLKQGVDINHRDIWGYTPLLESIQSKTPASTDIFRLLVDSGANLNDKLPGNSTALHAAVWEADLDKVRILLEFHTSVDIHSQDSEGDTPLLCSTNWDRPQTVECLRLLVRAGADVNAQNSMGFSLLMKSSWKAKEASAVQDFLLSLPETKVDTIAPASGYPLQVACRIGYEPLLHKLLDRGADVNLAVPGFAPTALISACVADMAKPEEKVELIVRELVARGAEPNFMSKNTVGLLNAMCAASFQARVETINFLLESGASVNQPDQMGRLPIHFAAAKGLRNFEAVALAYTGDIMAVDKADKNVLHWAAQFGNFETVKAIFERIPIAKRKAVVDCKDLDGWTPLAWAMRVADFRANDAMGFPEPRNYAGTVQYLIQQGADVCVTFRQGQGEAAEVLTPAELARRCGVDYLARLLIDPEKPEKDDIGTDAAAEKHASRPARYISRHDLCHMCFSTIYGLLYECQTCPQVRFCKKCHSNVELYHMVDDGKLHTFGINSDGAEEYIPDSPPLSASSKAMDAMAGSAVNADGDRLDMATGQSRHGSPQDDVTDVVDFSDLKDLGSFTDSE